MFFLFFCRSFFALWIPKLYADMNKIIIIIVAQIVAPKLSQNKIPKICGTEIMGIKMTVARGGSKYYVFCDLKNEFQDIA